MNEIIIYILLFVALYFEIFLLMTYLEVRSKMKVETYTEILGNKLPTVAIVVPCWNEETTIVKTIFSLLKLDYPKDKLSIIIVDDGSTDKTWNVLQRFARNKQVKLFQKENGGKHTAVNFGLSVSKSDLVGCLDADSFVHPQALKRIVNKFSDQSVMAVTPSMKINNPQNYLELIQKVEYVLGIFIRKVLSHLNALYITPGPFSIFKREVFTTIGNYRKAHNTEDLEMALRMQQNRMRIENAHDAYVYTTAPNTLGKLYKQRVRWTYGFLKNAIDYRKMFFKPEYGHLGIMILPLAGFSIFSSLYFAASILFDSIKSLLLRIEEIRTVGLSWSGFNMDLFYVDTRTMVFLTLAALMGTIALIFISRGIAQERMRPGKEVVYFLAVYSLIVPFWMARAVFNVVFAKTTKWR